MRADTSRFVGPGPPRRTVRKPSPQVRAAQSEASKGEEISQILVSSLLVAFATGVASGNQQTVGSFALPGVWANTAADWSMAGSIGWLEHLVLGNINTAVFNHHVLEYIWMPYQCCEYAGAYVATAAADYAEQVMAVASSFF